MQFIIKLEPYNSISLILLQIIDSDDLVHRKMISMYMILGLIVFKSRIKLC